VVGKIRIFSLIDSKNLGLGNEYWESGALLLPMFDAEWCVLRQFNKAADLTGFRQPGILPSPSLERLEAHSH
jgi:hypothetical protein